MLTNDLVKFCKRRGYKGNVEGYTALVQDTTDVKHLKFSYEIVFEGKVTNKIVVHECWHLTVAIMNFAGCTHTDSSEEAYAYLNEYLYDVICKTINILRK